MKIQTNLFLILMLSAYSGCSQYRAPGGNFELFKNTHLWELAKAVEREDKKDILKILRDGNVNLNYQEPQFKQTLLHLAIDNEKIESIKVLLNSNADLSLQNIDGRAAIHEAVNNVNSNGHSDKILELLIAHGADVNMVRKTLNNNGQYTLSVPLTDAVKSLACSKVLLEHGADSYLKSNDTYSVWFLMLAVGDMYENIFTAKHMIVDKKLQIPHPISYTEEKRPLDIFTLLNDLDLSKDPQRENARKEILSYLKSIDFPNNGVYVPK